MGTALRQTATSTAAPTARVWQVWKVSRTAPESVECANRNVVDLFSYSRRPGHPEGYPGPVEARYALPDHRRACDGGVAQGADGAKEVGRGCASHTHTSTLNFGEFLFHALR